MLGDLFDIKSFTDSNTLQASFLEPITITFRFSDAQLSGIANGSLAIYRHDGTSWYMLSGCTTNMSAHTVVCQTSAFSVFGLFGQQSSPTAASSSASGSSDAQELNTQCSELQPGFKKPKIYAAAASKNGLSRSIGLYFTPTSHPVDHYAIIYGTKTGQYQYGVLDIQGEDPRFFSIGHLKPGTTYYFRVRGGNGCATGEWSDEIQVKTLPRFTLKKGIFSFFPDSGKNYTLPML